MKRLTALCFFAGVFLMACADKAVIEIENLRCENRVNPEGIDRAPRLSWELSSSSRNILQTGYHILVASSLEKLNDGQGDIWDSGTIVSDESVYLPYGGAPLESRATYYWKVRVKTNRGTSAWSSPAYWTMGLTQPKDWQAQWTGLDQSFPQDVLKDKTRLSARYFRKEFTVEDKPVTQATLYLSGLGFYEAFINASKIGEQVFAPTPTDYSKVVKYNTFDVTSQLTPGANAIGVVLGNGRYFSMRQPGVRHFGFPKMILQLEVSYADGSSQTLLSDPSWKVTADGPICSNNEFDGEEYDAQKELTGWDKPGFDDSRWLQAEAVEAPGGALEAQLNKNIKVMETIQPMGIKEIKPGTHILDLGQNMVGWLRMKVKGEKGQQVQLRFAEVLKDDGTLYLDNIRSALVTDKYTLKGGGETEVWEPSFTYHGFRFVEITGYPGKPALSDFEGRVVYDEMELTGEFETSDPTINQVYKNAYWGIRGNYRGMPTDCPQRDERMGWLGDRAVGSQGESFIFDNHNLYAKGLDDIEQSQRETGSIPDVAPNYWSVYSDNMTWPGAYIIIANMLYEQYGDKEPIVKHYDSMKKWMKYMRDNYMDNDIMTKDTYGDWCMPPESPELIHSQDPARKTEAAVLGTTFYFRMLSLLQGFATLLDKPAEAQAFAEEATRVKEAFNSRFFNKETRQYSNNTVTANLLSLCYGMVAEEDKEAVFGHIVDKTMGEFKGHVSTGLVGIQWLMRGLTQYGRPDIALRIATNRSYPSWGYMVEHGATTIWELWNGDTADPAMNSGNHVMLLGDLIVWYYENLAGIRNKPGSTGFKEIELKPCPIEGLDWVTASYRSVRGQIASAWKKEGDTFHWQLSIPGNTTAYVYIPTKDKDRITESGAAISSVSGLRFIESKDGYALYEAGSGRYNFASGL
ncbi:MAG: glycoside hydrolase family 78 protein [Tannerellaceae bacterium]|jgi:alpha-L-rhamnosidase|nr:glycoside hydrolase family 78 protein [Tannerellaceae bacterium]